MIFVYFLSTNEHHFMILLLYFHVVWSVDAIASSTKLGSHVATTMLSMLGAIAFNIADKLIYQFYSNWKIHTVHKWGIYWSICVVWTKCENLWSLCSTDLISGKPKTHWFQDEGKWSANLLDHFWALETIFLFNIRMIEPWIVICTKLHAAEHTKNTYLSLKTTLHETCW